LLPHGIPGRWLGLVWLAPALLSQPPRTPFGGIDFTLLDVRQGLAAVVQTQQHILIYDAGPSFSATFDTDKAVIVPYLQSLG